VFQDFTIRRKMLLGFSVPILLMVVVALLADAGFRGSLRTARQLQHTQDLITRAKELQKLIVDMETGERGFLIAGTSEFLEPFDASQDAWEGKVKELTRKLGGNREQLQRLIRVDQLAAQWLRVAAEPEIAARRRGALHEVATLIESQRGKRIIDAMRSQLDQFVRVEREQLDQLEQAAEHAASRTVWITAAGTIVAIMLVVFTAMAVSTSVSAGLSVVIRGTRELSRKNLATRIVLKTGGEMGQLATAFNSMAQSLEEQQTELDRAAARERRFLGELLAAQESERTRVARELHDETGSALTSLILDLRNLQRTLPAGAAAARLPELQKRLELTLGEVKRVARDLYPLPLEQLGFDEAIGQYIRDHGSRHGLNVELRINELPERLSPNVTTALYRILQEALANVVRHAQARHVSVIIDRRGRDLVMVVEDDGRGMPSTDLASPAMGAGLGLHGIRERLALLHGELNIEPTPGGGTTLSVRVPVEA